MAQSRTINAPGIELREIDRSYQTANVDYSIPNSPTALFCGFSDIGTDYTVQWINTRNTLNNTYGYPQNEAERYLYNGVVEYLQRGGTAVVAKLPYNNASKDQYTYTTFEIDAVVNSENFTSYPDYEPVYNALNYVDSNINSMLILKSSPDKSGKMDLKTLDNLRTGNKTLIANQIRIVDISRGRYTKTNFDTIRSLTKTDDGETEIQTNDCLGIIPLIVTPTVALYYHGLLSVDEQDIETGLKFNVLSNFEPVKPNGLSFYQDSDISVDMSDLSSNLVTGLTDSILQIQTSNTDLSSYLDSPTSTSSMSKVVSQYFPQIAYKNENHFETTLMKQIGVVVLSAYTDTSNNNLINFQVLESFIGSLDKTAKDINTHSSIFIDNIVNRNSSYINLFSNISQTTMDEVYTIHMNTYTASSLGFYELDRTKTISYQESIIKPLTLILDSIIDPNFLELDLVVDCGVSNIAQYVTWKENPNSTIWSLNSSSDTHAWRTVIKKFQTFCETTRKDCMFIADGLRTLSLEGDQKIIRSTNPTNTVTKNILPKLRLMSGINSSYAAGYCVWFYSSDAYTGDYYWCPPSIKAASAYCYTDTYANPWNAPAGLSRGVTQNTYDVSFNPTSDEAGKIYSQSWNYALSYPIDGIVIEGQKTFQTNNTALTRINVRRLLLHLEKSVKRIAKYYKYENNTPTLRQQFVDAIRPIFERAVTRGGLSEYLIVCDETNNPTSVVDDNTMICQIGIRPIKTLEFIVLSFTVTNQSASIQEAVLNQ